MPKVSRAFWRDKIARNRARDADTDGRLTELGWTVMRFWEHDDVERAADAVEAAVRLGRARS